MPSKKTITEYIALVKKEINDKEEFQSILNEQDYDARVTNALSTVWWAHLEALLGTNVLFSNMNFEQAWTGGKILNAFNTAMGATPLNVANYLNFLFAREYTPPDGGAALNIVEDVPALRLVNTSNATNFPDGTPFFVTYGQAWKDYDQPDVYILMRGLGLPEETTYNRIVRPADYATTSNNFIKVTNLASNFQTGGPFYHPTLAARDLHLTQYPSLHMPGSLAVIHSEAATSGMKLAGASTAFFEMKKTGNFLAILKGNFLILDYASGSPVVNVPAADQILPDIGSTHILYTVFDPGTDTLKVHRAALPTGTLTQNLVSLTGVENYQAYYRGGVLFLAVNATTGGTSYVRAYNTTDFSVVATFNLPATHFTDKLLAIKGGNFLLVYTRTASAGTGTENLRILSATTLSQIKTITGVFSPIAEMADNLNGVIIQGDNGDDFRKLDTTGFDASTYSITTSLPLGMFYKNIAINGAKTIAIVKGNSLSNGSGDEIIKKLDLSLFTFVNEATVNDLLNTRPFIYSEGEDKLYFSTVTGTVQVRSAIDLSLVKNIAGSFDIYNFVQGAGKLYAGSGAGSLLYEISPLSDEYILSSPNGAYYLSADKTFWNRIVSESSQSSKGDELRAFETKAALQAYLAPKPMYTQGVVGKVPDRTNFVVANGINVDSQSIAGNLSRIIYADNTSGIVYVWRASTNITTQFTEPDHKPYEVKINKAGTFAGVRWRKNDGTARRFSIINLSTGVKTTIALPSLGDVTGIDFSSTHCAVVNTLSVHLVAISGFAFTTVVTSITGDKLAYSPTGNHIGVGNENLSAVDIIHVATSTKATAAAGGKVKVLLWAYDTNIGDEKEYLILSTEVERGITTVELLETFAASPPVVSYKLPYIGTQPGKIASSTYNGRVYATYVSSTFTGFSLLELNPYNGEISFFALPMFPLSIAMNSVKMTIYDGADFHLWDLNTNDLHHLTLGGDTGGFNQIMHNDSDTDLLAGVRTGNAGIVKLSNLNLLEGGVYEKIPTGLRKVGPPSIYKIPSLSLGGDGGEVPQDLVDRLVSLENNETEQGNTNTDLQTQINNLATSNTGLEAFPIQNGLGISKLYYKTNSTTYVQASPATYGTAKTRGLVVGISGGNLIGRLAGTTLTPAEIAAVTAAGVSISDSTKYYLGGSGEPVISPPTTPGYQLKIVLDQGNLKDEEPTEIGLEDYLSIEVNAAGTDVVPEYASRMTVTGNLGTAFARTPTLTGIADGKKLSYINKGVGVMTITGTFSGVVNPALDQFESIELEFFAGAYYIKNRFVI